MLGRFLFRWRGVIGTTAFGIVFWLARPTFESCLLGVPFLLLGLATRFWASGYIGTEGRAREIGASRRIVSGPYRTLRHPLYIGNSLLVAGMLVALRPAVWLVGVVVVGFIVEYGLIVTAEERYFRYGRSEKLEARSESAEVSDTNGERRGARGEGAEVWYGRSQKSEVRRQKAEVRTDGQSLRSLVGSPESTVQRPESFLLSRALCEWRTWVVTGAGYGLALLKALVAQ